jgi:hypothetical protein
VLIYEKKYSQKEIGMSGTRVKILVERVSSATLKSGEYEARLNKIIDELESDGCEVCKPIQPVFLHAPIGGDVSWFDAITTITYSKTPYTGPFLR